MCVHTHPHTIPLRFMKAFHYVWSSYPSQFNYRLITSFPAVLFALLSWTFRWMFSCFSGLFSFSALGSLATSLLISFLPPSQQKFPCSIGMMELVQQLVSCPSGLVPRLFDSYSSAFSSMLSHLGTSKF